MHFLSLHPKSATAEVVTFKAWEVGLDCDLIRDSHAWFPAKKDARFDRRFAAKFSVTLHRDVRPRRPGP